jgi:hypothetical protein
VTIKQAARALHECYHDASWFTAVGVAEHDGKGSIVVYVKAPVPDHVGFLKGGWYGFPVTIRKMRSPRLVMKSRFDTGH